MLYTLMRVIDGTSIAMSRTNYVNGVAVNAGVVSTDMLPDEFFDMPVDVSPLDSGSEHYRRGIPASALESCSSDVQQVITMHNGVVDSLAVLCGRANGLSDVLPENLNDWQESPVMQELGQLAVSSFSMDNPFTGEPDVKEDNFYAPMLALSMLSGAMGTQDDENGNSYCNPDGVVTVAEFLDSLYTYRGDSSQSAGASRLCRRDSIDRISAASDYFNSGYNMCLTSESSPFYKLYTLQELTERGITRVELAYITVICWESFHRKFGDVMTSGRYKMGCNVNWLSPRGYMLRYEDTKAQQYKVYKRCYNPDTHGGTPVMSVDLKDYAHSMTDLMTDMQTGKRGIPLVMFMSLFELSALNLFPFRMDDGKEYLKPLREVTRAELSYFLLQLARVFPDS